MKRDRDEEIIVDDESALGAVAADQASRHWRVWGESVVCLSCYPFAARDEEIAKGKLRKHNRGYRGVFASGNVSAQTRHLESHTKTNSELSQQTSLSSWQSEQKQPATATTKSRQVALMFCSLNLSFNSIEHRDAQPLRDAVKACGVTPSRRTITAIIHSEAETMRKEMAQHLCGSSVLLAIDGGTVLRRSYLNFCVAGKGAVFFLKTVGVKKLDAATIQHHVTVSRDELFAAGSYCVGVVSDNASAMVKATRDIQEEMADELEEDEDDVAPVDIDYNDAADDGNPFFYHCRCWCHTFQLLLQDVQKKSLRMKNAFETANMLATLLNTRVVKNKLEAALKAVGKTLRVITMPAITRWNTYIRCISQILPYCNEINMVVGKGEQITPVARLNLQLACIGLAPICWATDAAQSDLFTAVDGHALLKKVSDHMTWLKSVVYQDGGVRNEVLAVADLVNECVQARLKNNFSNRFFLLSDFFDPTTADKLDYESVFSDIMSYWELRGVEANEATTRTALMRFKNRNDVDKTRSTYDYWNARALDCSSVSEFCLDVTGMLQTEACVERSFMSQTQCVRPERNRLGVSTQNDSLFIKINAHVHERSERKHQPWLSETEWRELVLTLAAPTTADATGMATRATLRHTDAMTISRGSRLNVLFNVGVEKVWFLGTIVASNNGKYKIVYDSNPEVVENFLPLTVDTEWHAVD